MTARRIVDYRKEHGPVRRRDQLMQVEGIGPATYTQAAGFLKIPDGEHPLDRTWVHPESYRLATRLLEKFGFAPEVVRDKDRLPELRAKLAEADFAGAGRASWRSASSRSATSSTLSAGPSATRATISPSRSSRRAS